MTLIKAEWMKQSKNIWPVHNEFNRNLNCSRFISFDINFHFCQKKNKKQQALSGKSRRFILKRVWKECSCTLRRRPHLLNRQLLQLWQRAGQQPHQEGSGTAHNVQHGARQHGDEGVLPGEGVEQRHHGVHTAGQGADDRGERQNKPVSRLQTHAAQPLQRPHQIKQGTCFCFHTVRGVVDSVPTAFFPTKYCPLLSWSL